MSVLTKRPSDLNEALAAIVSKDAAVLFPSRDAEALEEMDPENFPKEIVVVDGTWHQAKTLVRDVPLLRAYRRVRFTPPAPSEYRIRKEPKADYLSTIESIAHVLSVIEPDTPGISELRNAFVRMIDKNVAARPDKAESARHKLKKATREHRFPDELSRPLASTVLVYCEGSGRFGQGQLVHTSRRHPLYVSVLRLGADRVPSEFLLRTPHTPPKRLLSHLGIEPLEFDARVILPTHVQASLLSLLHPSDTVVAWNASSLQILRELGVPLRSTLVLKGTYCDAQNLAVRESARALSQRVFPHLGGPPSDHKGWGGMEDILLRHGLPAEVPLSFEGSVLPGRGAVRICQTKALFAWLREEAERGLLLST